MMEESEFVYEGRQAGGVTTGGGGGSWDWSWSAAWECVVSGAGTDDAQLDMVGSCWFGLEGKGKIFALTTNHCYLEKSGRQLWVVYTKTELELQVK